ncbi:hypothetical protein [Azospirillum rugosum]|uniref:hypothetical protein n=1 Tax=Azospirillum rugosum TaxID=416170 RepID=UPI001AE1E2CF|nr:hypothetical protein [Azospirillum rugosum]
MSIATYEQQKARLMAMARGEHKPAPGELKIWFSSIEIFGQALTIENGILSELIATKPAFRGVAP